MDHDEVTVEKYVLQPTEAMEWVQKTYFPGQRPLRPHHVRHGEAVRFCEVHDFCNTPKMRRICGHCVLPVIRAKADNLSREKLGIALLWVTKEPLEH
jgi:hypothetical protein